MTQPIDIPIKKSRHRRPFLTQSLFPEDEGPYFGYIELFEGGHIYRAISSGSGRFVEVSSRCALPSLSFVVEKDRLTKRITLEIASSNLKQAISRAIFSHSPISPSLDVDFDTVLKHYDVLKVYLGRIRSRYPYDDVTLEMRLLIEDLLLERALYDGIGMEILRQRQELCMAHLQDIHARHISSGLSEIEACFSLGLIPDEKDEEYLRALNDRYAELARLGDYAELRNLCEPIVRSGEIELPYNPSLLLDVLDNGHLEVFQYVLDLVDRTKQSCVETVGSQYTDVTFDPLYVAIRLGNIGAVRCFINEHATFEGYVTDEASINPDRIFTPVVAAVYWQQADILRLLLATEKDSIYHAGLPRAMAMAADQGTLDVLQVLIGHQPQSLATTFTNDNYLFHEYSSNGFNMFSESFEYFDAPASDPSQTMSRSVSGIANALNNFGTTSDAGFPPAMPNDPPMFEPTLDNSEFLLTSTPTIFVESVPPIEATIEPTPSQPAKVSVEEPSLLSIRRTNSHETRRKLGRNFKRRLEGRCKEVTRVCKKHSASQAYDELCQCFKSTEKVWKKGTDTFRKITRNRAPTGLSEILQGLLVADALICQISKSRADLEKQFVDDLGRWRTLLEASDQLIYDEIACAVWNIPSIPTLDTPETGTSGLYRFQELIQSIVSLDDLTDQALSKTNSFGRPLLCIQQRVKAQKQKADKDERFFENLLSPEDSFQSIASVFSRLTKDTDSLYDEDKQFAEFINFEALETVPEETTTPSVSLPQVPHSQWKDIHPMIVLLLASVAFSVVLSAVSAIQSGHGELSTHPVLTKSPGYGRSCAVVERFLSFDEDRTDDSSFYDSGVDVGTPCEKRRSPWISEMKEASKTNTGLRSRNILGESTASSLKLAIPGSISSPSGSSYILTDASSPEADRVMVHRVKCQSWLRFWSGRRWFQGHDPYFMIELDCRRSATACANVQKEKIENRPLTNEAKKPNPSLNPSLSPIITQIMTEIGHFNQWTI